MTKKRNQKTNGRSNGNGRYDAPWSQVGPDGGESDQKYSAGETLGTDVFEGMIGRIGFPVKPLAQNFMTRQNALASSETADMVIVSGFHA